MAITLKKTINKEKCLLIICEAETNYMLNQITYFETYNEVLKSYGESQLTESFRIAKSIGVEDIFLLNLKNEYDYIEIADLLKHGQFGYVVMPNIKLSDTYNDIYYENRKISYIQNILSTIGIKNNITIVTTEKHAGLYEDIDAFLNDMSQAINTYKNKMPTINFGENLIFVANNLKKYEMADVVLASVLCVTEVNKYPEYNFGEAIFDIDFFDNINDMAYFKNNYLSNTTVENLLNFYHSGPQKIVTIYRILKHIKNKLDFSEYNGKQYSDYLLLKINRKLETILKGLLDYVITDFEIISLTPYKDISNPGTIIIFAVFNINPINTTEKCTMEEGIAIS